MVVVCGVCHVENCIYSHDTKKVGCMFFHVTHNCTRGASCKFSHDPISAEELAELKRIHDEVEMEKHSVETLHSLNSRSCLRMLRKRCCRRRRRRRRRRKRHSTLCQACCRWWRREKGKLLWNRTSPKKVVLNLKMPFSHALLQQTLAKRNDDVSSTPLSTFPCQSDLSQDSRLRPLSKSLSFYQPHR